MAYSRPTGVLWSGDEQLGFGAETQSMDTVIIVATLLLPC